MVKLALPSNKDFTDLTDLSICFVRVGAFSSAWTPTQRNPEPSNFCLGDFIEGIVLAPSSKEYRFASLVCWKRASMSEWKAFNKASRFCPGQIQIDSDAVFKLPILGSSNFPAYTDQENNVFTCCLQPPRLVRTVLESRSRAHGRISRLDSVDETPSVSVGAPSRLLEFIFLFCFSPPPPFLL